MNREIVYCTSINNDTHEVICSGTCKRYMENILEMDYFKKESEMTYGINTENGVIKYIKIIGNLFNLTLVFEYEID